MKYKAIFFDRDGTLTYFTKEKEAWRDGQISTWSGKPFDLPYEKMMKLFHKASEGKKPWYKTLEDERNFLRDITDICSSKRALRKMLIKEQSCYLMSCGAMETEHFFPKR